MAADELEPNLPTYPEIEPEPDPPKVEPNLPTYPDVDQAPEPEPEPARAPKRKSA